MLLLLIKGVSDTAFSELIHELDYEKVEVGLHFSLSYFPSPCGRH